MTPKPERHDLFTPAEWAEIDRVTERWSSAGRAKDDLMASPTIDGRKLEAAFKELSGAAADYRETIEKVLAALRSRRPRE